MMKSIGISILKVAILFIVPLVHFLPLPVINGHSKCCASASVSAKMPWNQFCSKFSIYATRVWQMAGGTCPRHRFSSSPCRRACSVVMVAFKGPNLDHTRKPENVIEKWFCCIHVSHRRRPRLWRTHRQDRPRTWGTGGTGRTCRMGALHLMLMRLAFCSCGGDFR